MSSLQSVCSMEAVSNGTGWYHSSTVICLPCVLHGSGMVVNFPYFRSFGIAQPYGMIVSPFTQVTSQQVRLVHTIAAQGFCRSSPIGTFAVVVTYARSGI